MHLFRIVLSVVVSWFFTLSGFAAKVVLVAGGGDSVDGVAATQCKLTTPFGVDFDKAGNLFFVELTGQRVGKVDPRGILTIVAGTGEKGDGGDGGPARQTQFNGLHSLAVAPNDDLFLADTWNNRVRKIDAQTGLVSTFAGTGQHGFSGDGGLARSAKFSGIYCVALDPKAERLFLADLENRRIREVRLKTGVVKTIAGNGERGVPAEGAEAVNSPLVDPRAVAADGEGNIYILERSGHALRVLSAAGKIHTVVGTGIKGNSGDGGDARQATLNGPKHLCLDRDGNILIADTDNHVIRKYLPREKRIVHVAGTGKSGSQGVGGPPEQVELNQPHGVYVHPSGTLYIADSHNNRILKLEP